MISMFTVCLLLFSDIITQAKTIELHSSCNDITTDGLYYIKPSEKGAIIPVICSNGYVMIDLSLDINMNSYSSYLSSWDYGRNNMDYILPNLDDKSTFRSWWLLSDSNTKFTVAPNCNSCELSNNDIVYYSDSSLFCFSIYNSGDPCLDDIYPQYSCNKCDVIHQQSHCFAMRMNPDTPINYDHNECVTHGLLYRPSMSFQRNACNCYKPLQQSFKYIVNINDLPPVTSYELLPNNLYIDENIIFDKNNDIITGNNCNKNKIYLTNNDFKSGTYRIFNCGEYILTEDIIFNFNAPTIEQELDVNFSPNSIYNDELYWFPKHSDDINGKYSARFGRNPISTVLALKATVDQRDETWTWMKEVSDDIPWEKYSDETGDVICGDYNLLDFDGNGPDWHGFEAWKESNPVLRKAQDPVEGSDGSP
eukprot:238070_1